MKFLLSTLTAIVILFAACQNTPKQDSALASNPVYQEIKTLEAQGDKALPTLNKYRDAMRPLLHSMEAANQVTDSTSMSIRKTLSELNKAENAFVVFKQGMSQNISSMDQASRDAFLSNSKTDATAAVDMVLYNIKEARRFTQMLRDRGIQVTTLPDKLPE